MHGIDLKSFLIFFNSFAASTRHLHPPVARFKHMKLLLILLSLTVFSCAGVPQQKARINPTFYSQEVNPLFMKPAAELFQEMHRECQMKSPRASYKVSYLPLTKPLLYSNANAMVQQNHLRPSQLEEVRASSLKVFGDGRRCFQKILSAADYKDYGKFQKLESGSDQDWEFKVTNGKTSAPLKELKASALRKIGLNPPDLVLYELAYCTNADLDYSKDVVITSTLKTDKTVSCQVAWMAH